MLLYFAVPEKYKLYEEVSEMKQQQHIQFLVVDDEELTGRMALMIVQELGYRAHLVSSAPEALEYLREHSSVSAVLSDVNMPGMQGTELCRIIKRDYGLPVVLMSGLMTEAEAQDAGCDGYLHKPFKLPVAREVLTPIVTQN